MFAAAHPNSSSRSPRRFGLVARGATATLACLALLGAASAVAGAAIKDEFLFRMGSGSGAEPAGPGKIETVRGIASEADTGHVYLASSGSNTNRVSEFTPWGEFVKAFGWDVAPGAVNETQELRVRASEGTFNLGFEAATTAELSFDASGEEVEDALNALATIGGAGGAVEVSERAGSPSGEIPFIHVVVFKGALAGTDVAAIEAAEGATPLGGGDPETELEVRTRADGTPGGTGLEACTAESGCKAGVAGGGSGQLDRAAGVAIDLAGDVYIRESAERNNRIQKFDSAGRFLWAAGGEVNKTKTEEAAPEAQRNLCVAGTGDVCQAGTLGTGGGQFAMGSGFGGIGVAIGPSGALYVSDLERIQTFDLDGNYLGDLPDPEGLLAGVTVRWMALDPDRDRLYFSPEGEDDVRILDASSGAGLGTRAVKGPAALTVDTAGDLYAVEESQIQRPEHIAVFGPGGNQILPDSGEIADCEEKLKIAIGQCEFFGAVPTGFSLRGLGTGPGGDFYATSFRGSVDSYVNAYGPAPISFESPPSFPPAIEAQYATEVGIADARLRADVNPRFYSGELGTTTYYLRYASAECIESGGWEAGCVAEEPEAPGNVLQAGIVDEAVPTGEVILDGLSPGTEYRYRFVAEGSGAPGVEIVGVGGSEGEAGAEASFTTRAPAPQPDACPANAAYRLGASAQLPDCRAYELVSPLDKEGGEIKVLDNTRGLPAVLERAATSGSKLAYGSYRSFGDAEAAPYTTQYIATRGEGAWTSEGISPPKTTQIIIPLGTLDTEFKLFSEDLCEAWLRTYSDPPLAAGAVEGYSNLYRRENCATPPIYEALSTVEPPAVAGPSYVVEFQGTGGATTILTANAKLTAAAPIPMSANPLLYARGPEGELAYVCVLPGGTPNPGPCTAGGKVVIFPSQNLVVRLDNAISEDGDRIFWTDSNGTIYLREDPLGAGVTTKVSGTGSQYWGAATDGARAVFSEAGKLISFEVAGKAKTEIAGQVAGVVGMSEDANRVYVVSREDRDEGGPAAGGEPNLYLWEAEVGTRFIATLAEADVDPGDVSAVGVEPRLRATRVSPDGAHAAFMSAAPLTGYDNTDQASGEPDTEVFLYDAEAGEGAGRLICASCNPSGARPKGTDVGLARWVAAQIPVAQNNLNESRLLSEDGSRLYFESFDALALGDTNGTRDVYQWEQAGAGSCDTADPGYSPAAAGCIELISSGQSSIASRFVEASPEGDDVFFTTLSSLVSYDPDQLDVYDARVGGGLPAPPSPPAECEGEACQSPPPPPEAGTPSSATYTGPGDLEAAGSTAARCNRSARRAKRLAQRAKRQRAAARRAKAPATRRKRARAARRAAQSARELSKNAKRCRARARAARRPQR